MSRDRDLAAGLMTPRSAPAASPHGLDPASAIRQEFSSLVRPGRVRVTAVTWVPIDGPDGRRVMHRLMALLISGHKPNVGAATRD